VIRRSPGKTVARRALIGAVALLVPALAGCEAGLNAPTLEFHPASNGATKVVDDIRINNAFVLGPPSGSTLPAGSAAGFFVALYNGGGLDDTLTSVTASGARSATIEGGPVSLPRNTSANLTGPEPKIVLSGLASPLTGGQALKITLVFQHAGSVTMQVPVEPQSFYYQTFSPPASPTP
jgi:copper(I)-binding protein